MTDLAAGQQFTVEHPFILEDVTLPPDDPEANGWATVKSWRPGVRYEFVCPDGTEAVADGVGAQELTVVDVHKPGRFPPRVFYTRQWVGPNGKRFGKACLRIKTTSAFRTLIRGYRYEYRLAEQEAE